MERELHETLSELRQGQINLVQSTARTEGWIAGAAKALDGINNTLAQVSEMRAELAALKEREKMPDPQVTLLSGRIDGIQREVDDMRRTETRLWVESLVKTALAGAGGGGLFLLGQHLVH